jgi:hypothetical protein
LDRFFREPVHRTEGLRFPGGSIDEQKTGFQIIRQVYSGESLVCLYRIRYGY